ncbi:thioesterase family protein [bacterium]|nr:thioesterase family protein [bacterium]
MNLHFRLLLTVLASRFKSKLSSFVETKTTFTVLPTDCHIPFFRLMCGGRYFDFMDAARVDQVSRLGILGLMRRDGLSINLGGQILRYRKPMKVFTRFTVSTKIIYWDDKFFYVEQKFEQNGIMKTEGLVQGCFRGKPGVVPPAELLKRAGLKIERPALPEIVKWFQSQNTAQ